MSRVFRAIAAALLLGACATPVPIDTADIDPNDAQVAAEGQVSPDGTVIVCRRLDQIGSRFLLKECKSEKAWEEWDAYVEENTKTALDNLQRNRCGGTPGRC